MIAKTPTGVDFFDEEYGGAYAGRSMLATGRSGTGKSVLSLQFLAQGLKLNERCLLLSVRPAEDVILYAATYGINLEEAVAANDFSFLNTAITPRSDTVHQATPPHTPDVSGTGHGGELYEWE